MTPFPIRPMPQLLLVAAMIATLLPGTRPARADEQQAASACRIAAVAQAPEGSIVRLKDVTGAGPQRQVRHRVRTPDGALLLHSCTFHRAQGVTGQSLGEGHSAAR